MKPLHIVHVVSSLQVGGMEQFVLRIAAAQMAADHKVSILALQSGPLLKKAEDQKVKVDLLGGTNPLRRIALGAAVLSHSRPDIIHAHNPTSLHYAALGKLNGKSRIVLTCHGKGKGNTRAPSKVEWNQVDAIIGVSDAVASDMKSDVDNSKLSVIRNGVELLPAHKSRERVRAELGIGSEIVGIIAARIDSMKGHDTLLRAWALLSESGIKAMLLIAGEGEHRKDREQLAKDLGLTTDHVRFLGYREDVPSLLAASDFFVLPSLTEGMPLSILEAMSHRLPIIATDVGGIPEVVTNGEHGLLVAPESPEELSLALKKMISDADLRAVMGEKGWKRVQSEFSFATMLYQYEKLYLRVLKAKRSHNSIGELRSD